MSKPVQFFTPGYQPPLPPQLPALQLIPNPVQRYVQVLEQIHTLPSIIPTNPQLLTPVSVQITRQVALNAFWRFPFYMPLTPFVPVASQLNVPVPPQPPAAPAPAAQPVPVREKRPRPYEIKFVRAKEQALVPPATVSIPSFPVNGTAIIRTLMHEGTTLLKQQKYLESIECFRKGFFIDPTAHFMFYLLTACQGVLKEIRPEILRYVGNALSRNPKDMNALFLKGLCYIEPGKYHIALTCFDSILMTSPNDQMISVLNHEVYKMHNRDTKPPEAEDAVQKASVKRRMAVSTLLN